MKVNFKSVLETMRSLSCRHEHVSVPFPQSKLTRPIGSNDNPNDYSITDRFALQKDYSASQVGLCLKR